jgi:hypothetical protein
MRRSDERSEQDPERQAASAEWEPGGRQQMVILNSESLLQNSLSLIPYPESLLLLRR